MAYRPRYIMIQSNPPPLVVGILLAAGFSRRFGRDKLLYPLGRGMSVAETSGQALIAALPCAIAVVRQDNAALHDALTAMGYLVAPCETNAKDMADSLKTGVLAAQSAFPHASGFVIALADMPFIQAETMKDIANQLNRAGIVQPVYHGQRGHPVGFSSRFASELLAIEGDQGAREILRAHAEEVFLLACHDSGIIRDIDTPADLP